MTAAAQNRRVQASSPLISEPLAERLRSKAEHLEELADQHRAARITLEQGEDE
ncbi:hypothetical protein ACWDZ6_16755 [Streptomyces sp. NPDC002926]